MTGRSCRHMAGRPGLWASGGRVCTPLLAAGPLEARERTRIHAQLVVQLSPYNLVEDGRCSYFCVVTVDGQCTFALS